MWLLLFMVNYWKPLPQKEIFMSVVQVGNKLHIFVDILNIQFSEYLDLVSVISFPTCYLQIPHV